MAPIERRPDLPSPRRVGALAAVLRAALQSAPLARPHVASDLTELSALERSAEVVRYAAARLEYWVSPAGQVRTWFRLNLLLAFLLAVPTILVVPVVTLFLSAVATWSQYLLTAAVNTLLTLLAGVGIAAIVSGACFFVRFLLRR